jgi:hypothetical protein
MVNTNKKKKNNKKYKKVNSKKRGGQGTFGTMGSDLKNLGAFAGTATTGTTLKTFKVSLGTVEKSVHVVGAVLEGVLVSVTAIFETLTALCISLPNDFVSIARVYISSNNEKVKKMCFDKLDAIFKKIIKITENSFELTFNEYKGFNDRLKKDVKINMEKVGCKQTFLNKTIRSSLSFSGTGCTGIIKRVQELINQILLKLKEIYNTLKENRSSIREINQTTYSALIILLSGKPSNEELLNFMPTYKKQIDPLIAESKSLVASKSKEKKEGDIHDLFDKLKEILKEIYDEKHKLNSNKTTEVSPNGTPQSSPNRTTPEVVPEVSPEISINKKSIKNRVKAAFMVNSRKLTSYDPKINMKSNKGTNAINAEIAEPVAEPIQVATPVA